MAFDFKPGTVLSVKVSKAITREAALKTLERIVMKDKTVAAPLEARSANFIELPKRRGGQIWTKRPNKLFPELNVGRTVTIKATPQVLKDLNSVAGFIEVSAK